MLELQQHPLCYHLREPYGLDHDPQIISLPWPSDQPRLPALRNIESDALHPVQHDDAGAAHILLSIAPHQKLRLQPTDEIPCPNGHRSPLVTVTEPDHQPFAFIENEALALKVPHGAGLFPRTAPAFGPILGWRLANGPLRGSTTFDTTTPPHRWSGHFVERGPLRTRYRFEARFHGGGLYTAQIILDAGQLFADITEEFSLENGDQLVWDLSGAHLPDRAFLLNSSPGYQGVPLHYYQDQRVARLASWNQYSQLFDLSDGFALGFPEADEIAGFVALNGGEWRGGNLNHMELWQRRWSRDRADSRRRVPAAAKADAMPGPEQIPARGVPVAVPHLNIEAWIGQGRRRFALVVSSETRITPSSQLPGAEPIRPVTHFEQHADRPRFRASQSLLRRLHTQRGVLSLESLLHLPSPDPAEVSPASALPGHTGYPQAAFRTFPGAEDTPVDTQTDIMVRHLEALVYGFWDAGGLGSCNCVAGRRLAPYMFFYEWLVNQGLLCGERARHTRSLLLFMAQLYSLDSYYPGLATMTAVDQPEALEPSLGGMANQNFYSDIYNVPGAAAQVFPNHPCAERWRDLFGAMWRRQLEYHSYPESGLWEESHSYFLHVLRTVFAVMMRRRADGVADEFALPGTQKLLASLLALISPRDALFGGHRHTIALGDHSADMTGTREAAAGYGTALRETNPTLAAQLAWLYRETGGTDDPGIAPEAPPWDHEYVEGLGYMFRDRADTGEETLLALRCGASWAHHHADCGSLHFFAFGRPLISDAAHAVVQSDTRNKYGAGGHSQWSLRDYQPLHAQNRFNRGHLVEHSAEPGRLAYAVGSSPISSLEIWPQTSFPLPSPIQHYRAVVQLGPAAFIVADVNDADPSLATQLHWHIAGVNVAAYGEAVQSAYENCALHVLPLLDIGTPRLELNPASPDFKAFATTEASYALHGGQPSLFLLVAQPNQEPEPTLRRESQTAVLSLADRKWRLQLHRLPSQTANPVPAALRLWMPFGVGLQRYGWELTAQLLEV